MDVPVHSALLLIGLVPKGVHSVEHALRVPRFCVLHHVLQEATFETMQGLRAKPLNQALRLCTHHPRRVRLDRERRHNRFAVIGHVTHLGHPAVRILVFPALDRCEGAAEASDGIEVLELVHAVPVGNRIHLHDDRSSAAHAYFPERSDLPLKVDGPLLHDHATVPRELHKHDVRGRREDRRRLGRDVAAIVCDANEIAH
mmetsp:Transcript_49128/g.137554  ORF Transcript_49128/g.137554 Transcript_49128/m.137554 type:complete len:200 (-) Transcript_49128:541-1140(-)